MCFISLEIGKEANSIGKNKEAKWAMEWGRMSH